MKETTMSMPTAERLRSIKTFPELVKYLRDELDWPIESDDFDRACRGLHDGHVVDEQLNAVGAQRRFHGAQRLVIMVSQARITSTFEQFERRERTGSPRSRAPPAP